MFIPASPLILLAASWVNTDTVLAAMGFAEREISELKHKGAVA